MHHRHSRSGVEDNRQNQYPNQRTEWTEGDFLHTRQQLIYDYQPNYQFNQYNQSYNRGRPEQYNNGVTTNIIDKQYILEVSPEMIVWLDYVGKFREQERVHSVRIKFQNEKVFFEGKHLDMIDAKRDIQEFVNDFYSRGYLLMEQDYDEQIYKDLIGCEEFKEICKEGRYLTVMSKSELEKHIQKLSYAGYGAHQEIINGMERDTLLIFCETSQKDRLINLIHSIINTNRKSQSQLTIELQNIELLWLSTFFDMQQEQENAAVRLLVRLLNQGHNHGGTSIRITIQGQQQKIGEFKNFIYEKNLSKWRMVLLRHPLQELDQVVDELKGFINVRQADQEFEIYSGEQISQTAMNLDNQYETNLTDYVNDLLAQHKFSDQCLFLLAKNESIDTLQIEAEQFLRHRFSIPNQVPIELDISFNYTSITSSSMTCRDFDLNQILQNQDTFDTQNQ